MSFDLKLLGKKLEQSRNNLQLEIKDISERIGIDPTRLKRIETGEQEPYGDEILILADFFKTDYNFYISNNQINASERVEILYRRFGNNFSKKDRWAIQEFLFLCECEDYVLKLLETENQAFKFTKVGSDVKKQAELAAIALRSTLGYSSRQIPNDIFRDFRKVGLHIFRRKLDNENISGLFINHPIIGKCILINYDEDIFRQNFTVAHEVGHSILDDTDDLNVSFKKYSKNDLQEIRANNFAANFLVPKDSLKHLSTLKWNEDLIIKIAKQLRVNTQTVLIRLKELNYINQIQYDYLVKIKVPSSLKEDSELQNLTDKIKQNKKRILEKGLSTFYVNKCYEAYSKGYISSRRLGEMFLVDESELSSLLDLFHLKLNYEN